MGKLAKEETLREGVNLLHVIVRGQVFDNWGQIQELVQRGLAPDYFKIGDQIEVKWTKGTTEYTLPFDVVSFEDVIKEGETESSPGMWLQSHYAMEGVQFAASRAAYYCESALPAGTYIMGIGTNWGTHCVAGKLYSFTTTQEIPAGGQIVLGKNNDFYTWGAPDQAPANWRVFTFATAGANTALESNLTLTEVESGTPLFTFDSSNKYNANGEANLQSCGYGYNRWSMSSMRKWLNSAEAKNAWWSPSDNADRPPQQLSTLDGFMAGFDADFLKALGKIKVTTALNTVSDNLIGASEDTYDTFFLASLEQEYIVPQAAGVEGAYWPYWKERLEIDSPQAWHPTINENHIRYAYENHGSAQSCRLRSAYRGNAYNVWSVPSTGYCGGSSATYAFRGCPACVIC